MNKLDKIYHEFLLTDYIFLRYNNKVDSLSCAGLMLLGCRQVVRHQILALAFRGFESYHPSQILDAESKIGFGVFCFVQHGGKRLNYQAFFFDFDYTLADSEQAIVSCFQKVLTAHGYWEVKAEAIRKTIGLTLEDSFSVLTGITDVPSLVALHREYSVYSDAIMTAQTFLYPDVLPTLREIKRRGRQVAIISTKFHGRLDDVVDKYQMQDVIDLIVGGNDVQYNKPDPEGTLYAIQQLRLQQSDVLFIGDSLIDANTAKNAGVDFAAVTTGTTTTEEFEPYQPVRVMPHIAELLTLL